MKKKFSLIVCCFIMCIYLTGCGEKENKKQEKNINLEITEYIKQKLTNIWQYSDEKYKINEDHSVEIIFNNVDDWSYCAYSTDDAIMTLIESNDELLKEIPNITFICRQDGINKAKTIYENISLITKENIAANAKYYDSDDNLITESVEIGFKNACNEYSYKEIFRNPEDYVLKKAKITGEVIQVMEQTESGIDYWVLRVNMTKDEYGYYSDTIMIMIKKEAINGRVLENDIFTFYGLLQEPVTYETIFGAEQTIPAMMAIYGELN